jgi:hypothetical protein
MCSVGDEMRIESARHNYSTHNHDPILFWDKLNTRVEEALDSPSCMSTIERCGFWQLVLALYIPTGMFFTFMREQRFRALQAKTRKHGIMTYLNLLVWHLNSDLLAVDQTSLEPMMPPDQIKLAQRVQRLLSDFESQSLTLNRYVIVLFDCDALYEIHKIRAVIVDHNLAIVDEENWSSHILVKESLIVEKVDNESSPSNHPSRGLTLKPKALQRKRRQEESSPVDLDEVSKE